MKKFIILGCIILLLLLSGCQKQQNNGATEFLKGNNPDFIKQTEVGK